MKLRKKQILSLVNQYYPHIENIITIRELNESGINSKNFLIITENEKFVLKQFFEDITTQKMEKICKIVKYCVKKNIKISEPIHTKEKRFVIRKFRMYLMKYYEGERCSCGNKEIIDLAKNLFLLHNELRKITPKYRFSRNNHKYKILNKDEVCEIENKIRRKRKLDNIDKQVIKRIDTFQEYRKQITNFTHSHKIRKQQLIHNDLIPSNAIFQNKHLIAIIDFSSLQLGSIYDEVVYSSFRFIIENTDDVSEIKNKIIIFINNYNHKELQRLRLREYKVILLKIFLKKISFLIRERYLMKSNLWDKDFRKFFEFFDICKLI